jgi:hypothetical protein
LKKRCVQTVATRTFFGRAVNGHLGKRSAGFALSERLEDMRKISLPEPT